MQSSNGGNYLGISSTRDLYVEFSLARTTSDQTLVVTLTATDGSSLTDRELDGSIGHHHYHHHRIFEDSRNVPQFVTVMVITLGLVILRSKVLMSSY